MKNMILTYIARYHKKITILSVVSVVILFMSFLIYGQPSLQPDNNLANEWEKRYKSSISIIDGKYKIDSNIVVTDRNKEGLISDLKSENLIRKTSVEEIPEFIQVFLDSISLNKKFDLANPWEKWRSGDIMDLVLHNIDVNAKNKNSVQSINEQSELPNKRLTYFSIGDNTALLSYHSSGVRTQQHIIIMKFQNKKIVDLWFGSYLDLYVNTRFEIMQQLEGRRNAHGSC